MPNYTSTNSPSGRYNHEFIDQGDGTYATTGVEDPYLGTGTYYLSSDGGTGVGFVLTFGGIYPAPSATVLATASSIVGTWLDNATYTNFTIDEVGSQGGSEGVTLQSLSAQVSALSADVQSFRQYFDTYVPGIDYKTSNIESGVTALPGSVWTYADRDLSAAGDTAIAALIRTELATELADIANLEARLTATRAALLDKLNVTGILAHTDNATLFKPTGAEIAAAAATGLLQTPANKLKTDPDGSVHRVMIAV
ncbi:hypothetical protein IAD21_00704 [Abditibacteriota bacterium]|nr:hypothetical protein IAD21_00704 [Abditibacteriota bacterium]